MGRFDAIPPDAASFEVRNAVFWFHDGVLYGRHKPHEPAVSLDDAITVFEKLRQLTGGQRAPMFFDGRRIGWLEMGARGYIRAHASEIFTHIAIVVHHELIRVLSHAIIGLSGLGIPVQLFTDEDKAWQFVTSATDAA